MNTDRIQGAPWSVFLARQLRSKKRSEWYCNLRQFERSQRQGTVATFQGGGSEVPTVEEESLEPRVLPWSSVAPRRGPELYKLSSPEVSHVVLLRSSTQPVAIWRQFPSRASTCFNARKAGQECEPTKYCAPEQ